VRINIERVENGFICIMEPDLVTAPVGSLAMPPKSERSVFVSPEQVLDWTREKLLCR